MRRLLADASIDDHERERRFVEDGRQDVRRTVGEPEAEQYAEPDGSTTPGRGSPGTGGPGLGRSRPCIFCDHHSLSARFSRFVFGENPRRTVVRVLVLGVISFIVFRWILIPISTEGSSMLPTLPPTSCTSSTGWPTGRARPARGDVVAIQMAGPHVLYVKRIVGLPGERVAIAGGQVLINGAALDEPYVRHRRPWDVAGSHARAARVFRDRRQSRDVRRRPRLRPRRD